MDKKSLRKLYYEKRRALSADDIENLSSAIAKQFSLLPLENVQYIHFFYPIETKKEVDSLQIADWLRANHPQIKLVLSKSNFEAHTLSHIHWDADTVLETNKWGITEPLGGKSIPARDLDMIIVPLLAYDMNGNRVGYGKGFYDRFLAECGADTLRVGVSFFDPEAVVEDADEHDIALDMCITPDKIWKF